MTNFLSAFLCFSYVIKIRKLRSTCYIFAGKFCHVSCMCECVCVYWPIVKSALFPKLGIISWLTIEPLQFAWCVHTETVMRQISLNEFSSSFISFLFIAKLIFFIVITIFSLFFSLQMNHSVLNFSQNWNQFVRERKKNFIETMWLCNILSLLGGRRKRVRTFYSI